jgi:hypothetical protein
MNPVLAIIILAAVTILAFLISQPRIRSPLSIKYWNDQTLLPNDLAKMFSYSGETDRIIEMLNLKSDSVPEAAQIKAAAAATAVPMLYHRHTVSWHETEDIIEALIRNLPETPVESTYALTVLGAEENLRSMYEPAMEALIDLLSRDDIRQDPPLAARICNALYYIHSPMIIEPLSVVMNKTENLQVKQAIQRVLDQIE